MPAASLLAIWRLIARTLCTASQQGAIKQFTYVLTALAPIVG
jgi:hypothetical protein